MDDCDHLFWPNPNQHYTSRQAPFLAEWMTEPEIQNQIATLQRWLAAAWRRLGDPALTPFDKRELRNQMKQADVALRDCLALASELKSAQPTKGKVGARTFAKPGLRFLT
jgi:hypothetical protein